MTWCDDMPGPHGNEPKPVTAEFDLSVLSSKQLAWVVDRAQNHHFDTVLLDRINEHGAWMTIRYDDGIHIHFYVPLKGKAEVLGTHQEH